MSLSLGGLITGSFFEFLVNWLPNRGFPKPHKIAVELGQSTQYRKVGHYGQIQFGHNYYSLANFGGSYICPTNTKGNFKTEKHEFKVDHSFF